MTHTKELETVEIPPLDDRHRKRKENVDAFIKALKKELNGPMWPEPMDLDPITTRERIEEESMSVSALLREAKKIANERFIYFQKQRNDLVSVTNEYARVDFLGKDLVFLQTFRSQIRKTIKKYMKYHGEMETFFHEFRNKFSRLVHKGEELSYLMNNNASITLIKKNHNILTKDFSTYLGHLINLRKESFRLIKELKNKKV